jgi:hypothetical protein
MRSLDPSGIECTSSAWWHDQAPTKTKKADVAEHPKVFDHVGLLVNELSSDAGLPFI